MPHRGVAVEDTRGGTDLARFPPPASPRSFSAVLVRAERGPYKRTGHSRLGRAYAACPQRHHVVFCSNAAYLPYVGVAAYSLLANNPASALEIVIIADGCDAENKR